MQYIPFKKRFFAKIFKTKNCWLWTGALAHNGYGLIRRSRERNNVRVHRAMWELTFGDIPPVHMVLHKCDTRNCVNPEHLFLGAASDNTDDMLSKKRGRGAPRSITDETMAELRKGRAAGESYSQLARRCGVELSTAWSIATGKYCR